QSAAARARRDSERWTRATRCMAGEGLRGRMRKPRRWSPSGTEPPALIGSREAPTTAIVVARSRTAWGDLGMLNSTLRGASVFETAQGNDHPDGARGH